MSWKVAKISKYSTLGTISDYIDDVNGFLIRVGNRDPKTGQIFLDTKFRAFVSNLRPYFGKIKIGYYFTTQAINEEEAAEEANFVLDAIDGFENDFPVFFDVDLGNVAGTGRADQLDKEYRYKLYKVFDNIVENSGIIIDYNFQTLINIPESDKLGAVLIKKYSSMYPTIPGVVIDGWEYANNDITLEGTSGVCPITVYNDIAHWEESSGKPISDYINELKEYSFEYTGKQIRPEVLNPHKLIYGVDYNVFYSNNIIVPDNDNDITKKPTVTVYGLNSYSGTSTMYFGIFPAKLKGNIVIKPSSAEYTGNPIRPSVSLPGLNNNTDYYVIFQDNVNVGNYLIYVIGRKNYEGELSSKFTITPKAITDDMFYIEQTSYVYTGESIKPEVKTSRGTKSEWDETDDGRFEYGDIEDPDYVEDYDLVDFDGGDVSEGIDPEYIGDFDFNNMIANFKISYGENIDVGKNAGTITIQGMNNFTGEVTITFDIVKNSIDGDFKLDEYDFTYNEKHHEPKVICVSGDMEEGVDYTVSYENNLAVGTATAIITGIYPYTAVTTIEFNIHEVDINSPCYTWRTEHHSYKYMYEPVEPEIIVEKDETGIEEHPTFDVTYTDNTNFGTGKAHVVGNGNFTGSLDLTFQIVARDISTDCICRCGEPTEDGLYDFNKFEVYDTVRDRVLIPYRDYYYDNESYYTYYPYNPTYIRVYRKVTGYYNYTGELESTFPTFLPGVDPLVPKKFGIPIEILFMEGREDEEMPPEEKEEKDPEPEVVEPEYDPWVPDEKEDEDEHHSEKWIPTEDLFPVEKDITEDADKILLEMFPAGTVLKLYNCKYYSSPENPYTEPDVLTGAYYIYNYNIVADRVRMTRTRDQINLPGRTTGWVSVDDLYLNLDNIDYRVGDYVMVLKDIYRNPDGTGGIIAMAGQYMYINAIATALAWDFGAA